MVEPEHITGFPASGGYMNSALQKIFSDIHTYYEPTINDDPEMLYVVGLIANMFGFMFDDPDKWEKFAEEYRWRYRTTYRYGIDPKIFSNRGAYGDYFQGQANVENGY